MKIYFDVLKNSGRLKKAVCVLFALSAVLFYFLVIAFFFGMQIDRILQKANDEGYKMSLLVKIMYWVTLFFGLCLCGMQWGYINQHFAEWGSFNKVGKSL